jgi:RHS repeat-associated protein
LLSKAENQIDQRYVGDGAIAQLATMYVRCGRRDALQRLFKETQQRSFAGPSAVLMVEARDALRAMQESPSRARVCGPAALEVLEKQNKKTLLHDPRLFQINATERGTNLQQLEHLSEKIGLNYRAARRVSSDAPLITPSLVHWKIGHYAALVAKVGPGFIMEDPTYGSAGHKCLSQDAIDKESDGYFLIPRGKLLKGWVAVAAKESASVWGSAPRLGKDNRQKGTSAPVIDLHPSPDQCSTGMPTASVFSMQTTLHLVDIPLSYPSPIGKMENRVNYNFLESSESTDGSQFALGVDWGYFWSAYVWLVQAPDHLEATVHTPGGGSEFYTSPFTFSNGSFTQTDMLSHATLYGTYDSGTGRTFTRTLPDGTTEVYTAPEGNGRYWMTSRTDKSGNTTSITYSADHKRISSIKDPLQRVTTFTFASNDPLQIQAYRRITKITAPFPFERACFFVYSPDSTRVISITDMYGLKTTFSYDPQSIYNSARMISQMVTPYGDSLFNTYPAGLDRDGFHSVLPDSSQVYVEAWLDVTTTGGRTLYWSRENSGGSRPQSAALQTLWMLSSPGNPTEEAIPHQTIPPDVTAPKLPRTTFVYANQSVISGLYYVDPNAPTNRPTEIHSQSQVSSAERIWQYSYNSAGFVLSSLDPLSRKFNFDYDVLNNLTAVRQTQGTNNDYLARWTYGSTTADRRLPVTMTDGSARTTSYQYITSGTVKGQLQSVTDPMGSVWMLNYGTISGTAIPAYLLSIDGPLTSDTTNISYDSVGRVQKTTDPRGYAVTFSWDGFDRLTQVSYPDGTSEQIAYYLLDPVAFRDRNGRWLQQAFDSLRQPAYQIDSLGRKTSTVWCLCGAIKQLVDACGRITQFDYDAAARLTQKTYPGGKTIQVLYDEFGQVATRKDSFTPAQTTAYTYNGDNSLNTVQYSNLNTPNAQFHYDSAFPRISAIDTINGSTTKTESFSFNPYVTSNQNTVAFLWAGGTPVIGDTVTVTVAAAGFNGGAPYSVPPIPVTLTEQANPPALASLIAMALNADPNLHPAVNPPFTATATNTMVSLTHNISGAVTFTATTSNPRTTVTQGGGGRMWESVNANNSPSSAITLSYDNLGRIVTRSINGSSDVSSYSFDQISRLTNEVNPLTPSGSIAYSYLNPNQGMNQLASISFPLNVLSTTLSWFDNARNQRLQQITNSGTSSVLSRFNYTYSPAREILQWTQEQNGGIQRKIFEYDQASRLITAQSASGSKTQIALSGTPATNDVVTVTVADTSLNTNPLSIGHTVTSGETLATIASALNTAINANSDLSSHGISSTVVPDTSQVVQTSSSSTRATQIGASSTTSTGGTGSELIHVGAPSALTPFSDQLYYSFDRVDNLIGIQHTAGSGIPPASTNIRNWSTDSNLNQIQQMSAGGPARFKGTSISGLKSAIVNGCEQSLTTSKTFSGNGDLTASSTASAAITTVGAASQQTVKYAVNVTGPGTENYAFDANGNMTSQASNLFTWDGENRLTKITYSGGAGDTVFQYDALGRCILITETGTATGSIEFVWCGTERCEQIDRNGLGVEVDRKRFFSSGAQILQGANTSSYFYTRDQLGSVREMISASGALQAQYSYSPFGERTKIAGSGPDADFGFAGMYFHARSGLNLTMFRAYSPSLGRWLSRDPMGESMGPNLYGYVRNNPMNFRDPLGLSEADAARIIGVAQQGKDLMMKNYQSANPGELSNFLSGNWWDGPIPNPGEILHSSFQGCADQAETMRSIILNTMFPTIGPYEALDDQWILYSENTPDLGHSRLRAVSSNSLDPDIIIDPWKNDIGPAAKGWDSLHWQTVPYFGETLSHRALGR